MNYFKSINGLSSLKLDKIFELDTKLLTITKKVILGVVEVGHIIFEDWRAQVPVRYFLIAASVHLLILFMHNLDTIVSADLSLLSPEKRMKACHVMRPWDLFAKPCRPLGIAMVVPSVDSPRLMP